CPGFGGQIIGVYKENNRFSLIQSLAIAYLSPVAINKMGEWIQMPNVTMRWLLSGDNAATEADSRQSISVKSAVIL
ncbi:hypothetical protein, partial [Aggregatibacter actinomycetemcomitans]